MVERGSVPKWRSACPSRLTPRPRVGLISKPSMTCGTPSSAANSFGLPNSRCNETACPPPSPSPSVGGGNCNRWAAGGDALQQEKADDEEESHCDDRGSLVA